jgi:hypothetical protein
MMITFLKDTPTSINCKPYPKNAKEQEAEYKWLQKEVALGRLKEGPSLIVSPIYFIAKKDSDELQPIFDYRRVNKWMV